MSNRVCFTLANPTALIDINRLPKFVSYLVYQEEVGDGGLHHFQGYMELSVRKRYETLKSDFKDTGLDWNKCHFESCKGSPESNKAYCTKEDTRVGGPYEFGEMRPWVQGKLTVEGNSYLRST